jgi:hypothetical protein
VRVPGDGGERRQQTQSFRTTTAGPMEFADWLRSFAVTIVAVESPGV